MLQLKEGYVSISPANGEQKAFFPFMEDAEIEFKLKEVEQGFEFLKSTTFEFRKKLLYDIAAKIEEKAEHLAFLVTEEMGKPISQAKAEIGKCAEMARYHADHGEQWLATETTDAGSVVYEFRQEALGPVDRKSVV